MGGVVAVRATGNALSLPACTTACTVDYCPVWAATSAVTDTSQTFYPVLLDLLEKCHQVGLQPVTATQDVTPTPASPLTLPPCRERSCSSTCRWL